MGLAARGLRDLGHGKEPITDPAELAQVRSQARRVYVQAIVTAVVLTAILVAVG